MTNADNMLNMMLSSQEYVCLGKLSDEVNHSLKNLLMGIIGHTEIDLKKNPESRLHKLILKNGYEAENILKSVSEWQHRNTEKHVCGFPVSESVDDVLELLESLPDFKGIDFRKDYKTADLITASKCELSQAILSILYRCIHSCGVQGSIDISLRTQDSRVTLQIRDTAKGITQNQADALFTDSPLPPESSESSKDTEPGTNRSELFVAGKIIEKYNGQIHCTACPDTGCEYTIRFPVRRKVPMPLTSSSEHKSMLILERDEVVRDVISETLNSYGYRTYTAETMAEAFSIYSDTEINLIILDFHYEISENISETIQKIRKHAPHVPLLLISCIILDSKTLDQAQGISAFMQKPFEINSLRNLADILTLSAANTKANSS